jgi:pimeloyl-ACP methyl ester carboxylesterase
MILHSIEQGPARQDEGPAILLLHGLFGSAKNLGAIARALGTRARVISLDIRNHGESPHAAAMDYAAMAADVAETAASLGVERAIVVGHSMGGKISMVLALTRPEMVEKLVVLDIAPVAYHHGYDDYVAGMKSIIPTKELTRHAADAALAAYVPEPAFRSFLLNNLVLGDAPRWRVALDEIGAAMPELVAWDDPGGVFQGPALFVRGANSSYVRDESRDKILQLFPKAEMVTVAGAGHWLHAEQPKAVIAALEGFLFS